MNEVKIIKVCANKFNKENNELKNNINNSLESLAKKINQYHNNGIDFIHIFNDNAVKYDKHGEFFTYKYHGKNNCQLRVLYACIQDNNITYIFLIDYMEKRRNEKRRGSKDHVSIFAKYENVKLTDLCKIK